MALAILDLLYLPWIVAGLTLVFTEQLGVSTPLPSACPDVISAARSLGQIRFIVRVSVGIFIISSGIFNLLQRRVFSSLVSRWMVYAVPVAIGCATAGITIGSEWDDCAWAVFDRKFTIFNGPFHTSSQEMA